MIIKHKNSEFRDALRNLARAATNVLIEHRGTTSRLSQSSDSPLGNFLILDAELAALPEFKNCLRLLKADSTIANQLDVMAGTSVRSRTPTAEALLRSFLNLVIRWDQGAFNEDQFELEYASLEKAYYSSDIQYDVLAPLVGVLINSPISLSENLDICLLKDTELGLEHSPHFMFDSKGPFANQACAIHFRYWLPKRIGDDFGFDPVQWKEELIKQKEANDIVDEVVSVFRLLNVRSVFTAQVFHITSRWSCGQTRFHPMKFQPEFSYSHELSDGDLKAFQLFWANLQSNEVKNRRFLDLAVRRLSYAYERHRLEDSVLDLLIAAEALFLNDQNKDTGELRYRLSLRAAFFIGTDSASRQRVFQDMKAAYDLRSTIAHGGNHEKFNAPKKADGSPQKIEEFIELIKSYMAAALRKAINLACQPNNPKEIVKWDELVFRNK